MIDMYSDAYRHHPYPHFQKARALFPIFPLKKEGCWAVSRYDDVKIILKNHELFSSADIVKEPAIFKSNFLFYTRGMVGMDKPEHTRFRQLLYKIFPQNKIDHLAPTIRKCCQQLLNRIRNQISVDFVDVFSAPLPLLVMAKLLGIGDAKIAEFRHWVLILLTWRLRHYPDKEACIYNMFHYFTDLINRRKKTPRSDIISGLISASLEDKTITELEVLAFIRLLLVGGTDTTTHLLGNALQVLLHHPEYIRFLQNQPHKIDAFIEETLRYDGPVLTLYRRVTQDIELNGMRIKKNNLVFPLIASANHDESIFVHSECFDMNREVKGHLSFGSGIHHCFSSRLARLQARIAIEEILNAWDFFETVDEKPPAFIESFFFRGLKHLFIKINWK